MDFSSGQKSYILICVQRGGKEKSDSQNFSEIRGKLITLIDAHASPACNARAVRIMCLYWCWVVYKYTSTYAHRRKAWCILTDTREVRAHTKRKEERGASNSTPRELLRAAAPVARCVYTYTSPSPALIYVEELTVRQGQLFTRSRRRVYIYNAAY